MLRGRHRSVAGITVLLLLLGCAAAQANEADDVIHRLAALAREQARTSDAAGLAKTLGEIAKALSEASLDGISAVSDLNAYLATAELVQRSQDASPPSASEPAIASLQPERASPVPEVAVPAVPPSPPSPPERRPGAPASAPAPATASMIAPAVSPAPPEPVQEPVAVRPPATTAQRPAVAAAAPTPPPERPAPSAPTAAAAVATSPAPAEASQPVASAALIELLRRQGDSAIETGDISRARRFYRRGADSGCGACAEALARTYDAEHLRRIGAVGIRPDPAQAEAWRTRARQLGWTGTP